MTPRQHSDTETRLAGFEAWLQDAFAWANDHGREIMVGLALFVLVGAIAAGVYEWRRRSLADEETDLARIDARFTSAMGANPGEYFVPEPANADQAKQAREAADHGARCVHRTTCGHRARGRRWDQGRRDPGGPRPARPGPRAAGKARRVTRPERSAARDRAAFARLRARPERRRAGRCPGLRGRRPHRGVSAARLAVDLRRRRLCTRQRARARDRGVPRGVRPRRRSSRTRRRSCSASGSSRRGSTRLPSPKQRPRRLRPPRRRPRAERPSPRGPPAAPEGRVTRARGRRRPLPSARASTSDK